MIERFHRTLKAAIKCYNNEKWTEELSTVLLGIRVLTKGDLEHSSAKFLYGSTFRNPGDAIIQD